MQKTRKRTNKIEASYTLEQGSGNSEIWISPADDDDVIIEPISKKNIISPVTKTNDNWQLCYMTEVRV